MFNLLGKRWATLNDAFYAKAPFGSMRGSYWFWMTHSFGNAPNMCMIATKIGMDHVVNGVRVRGSKDSRSDDISLFVWDYNNGKFRDLVIDNAHYREGTDEVVFGTDSGVEMACRNAYPKHVITGNDNGRELLRIRSTSSPFRGEFEGNRNRQKNFYNYKVRFSERGDSSAAFTMYKPPVIGKAFDLLVPFKGEIEKRKLDGMLWNERYFGFYSYAPWKYLQVTFENGPALYFYIIYRFSDIITSRAGGVQFWKEKRERNLMDSMKYDYYSRSGGPYQKYSKDTKYVVAESGDKDGNFMRMKLEMRARHKYEMAVPSFFDTAGVWWQMFFKIKDLLIIDGKNEYRLRDFGRYSAYGEDCYITRMFGRNLNVFK